MMNERVEMKDLMIGFMGVHNSFSEKASKKFVEQDHLKVVSDSSLMPLVDAFHVRDALLQKNIDLGVVAVRNSTTGIVAETKEAFEGMDVTILDEYALPIHQCFFKFPGVPMEMITCAASHPQALMQTRNTRRRLFGEMEEKIMEDTSLSARMLAEGKLPANTAVVCSMEAGMMNGLELIRENIEDKADNTTYFRLIRLPEKYEH